MLKPLKWTPHCACAEATERRICCGSPAPFAQMCELQATSPKERDRPRRSSNRINSICKYNSLSVPLPMYGKGKTGWFVEYQRPCCFLKHTCTQKFMLHGTSRSGNLHPSSNAASRSHFSWWPGKLPLCVCRATAFFGHAFWWPWAGLGLRPSSRSNPCPWVHGLGRHSATASGTRCIHPTVPAPRQAPSRGDLHLSWPGSAYPLGSVRA